MVNTLLFNCATFSLSSVLLKESRPFPMRGLSEERNSEDVRVSILGSDETSLVYSQEWYSWILRRTDSHLPDEIVCREIICVYMDVIPVISWCKHCENHKFYGL